MDAWRFINYTPDRKCMERAGKLSDSKIEIVVDKTRKSLNNDYKNKHYQECKDWFIESTMSGNVEEAKNWLRHFVIKSIAYGLEDKESDWKPKLLAAYDLYTSI